MKSTWGQVCAEIFAAGQPGSEMSGVRFDAPEDFICASEQAKRPGSKRCAHQCPSCKIWWPDDIEEVDAEGYARAGEPVDWPTLTVFFDE